MTDKAIEPLDRKVRGSNKCVTDKQDEIIAQLNRLTSQLYDLRSQVKALRKLEKERWKEES